MNYKNAQPIGEILKKIIKENRLSDAMENAEIFKAWDRVVGHAAVKMTTRRYIFNQKLYCHISSSVLRSQLAMNRSGIISQMNSILGRPTVKDIILK